MFIYVYMYMIYTSVCVPAVKRMCPWCWLSRTRHDETAEAYLELPRSYTITPLTMAYSYTTRSFKSIHDETAEAYTLTVSLSLSLSLSLCLPPPLPPYLPPFPRLPSILLQVSSSMQLHVSLSRCNGDTHRLDASETITTDTHAYALGALLHPHPTFIPGLPA